MLVRDIAQGRKALAAPEQSVVSARAARRDRAHRKPCPHGFPLAAVGFSIRPALLAALLAALLVACAQPTAPPLDVAIDARAAPDASVDAPAAQVTTLRVHYPVRAGTTLALRGSGEGLSWDTGVGFTADGDSVFVWRSTSVHAAFEWKPLLDDRTWSRGPNYRAAPGQLVDVYPHFTTVTGSWSVRWPTYMSSTLGNTRPIVVYLPPTYDENTLARFPVVYMHDGQNLFDPATSFGGVAWNVHDAMNAGAEDGSIREAIVVGVGNTGARIDEYTPTRDAMTMAGGRGDLYLRFLSDELRPEVNRTYRTLTGAPDNAIVGSSLGGLISAYAGVRMPGVWGLVGAMSPSTWWDGRVLLGEVASIPMLPARALRVYVDGGDAGSSMDGVTDTRALAAAYRTAGYRDGVDLQYTVQPGGMHSETYWRMRVRAALRFLLGPR